MTGVDQPTKEPNVLINPGVAGLGMHPFPRVAKLLSPIPPAPQYEVIDLTIGEPRFAPPTLITETMASYRSEWGKYPPNDGPVRFRERTASWLEWRFELPAGSFPLDAIVPTAGAREALFQLGLLVGGRAPRRLLAMPTPHYAPYRAAAIMAGLEPFYMPARAEHGYLPELSLLDASRAANTAALFLCTPSNPEGAIASPAYLEQAIQLARRHDFLLVVDECYSELYLGERPEGVLSACWRLREPGRDPFQNVVAVHSLSKRSSAAGLRIGFVCGDRQVMASYLQLRAYCGGTTPLPNLGAGAALLADEAHVTEIRARYRDNFALAHEALRGTSAYTAPAGGMFLWLRVEDDEDAAVQLWRDAALRVVPGSYLGTPAWDHVDHNRHYVRIAMTYPHDVTAVAMQRLGAAFT
jgi:N-succinyldiaminopimelate aminotransferase